MAGSPRAIGKRITTTHNRAREDARKTPCALSLRIYRKGKRKYKDPQGHKNKQGKQRGQAENNKGKASEYRQRDKNKGKHREREKTEANTQQAIKPPNSTRVQKPHKPRKAPD